MDAKIYSAERACFHINKINPPQLVVEAVGTVNSSGWSGGRLVPYSYVTPPADGIQDFDFLALAPSGMVLWAMQPITGHASIELSPWMKGVRIHTSTNAIEVLFEDTSCAVEARIVVAERAAAI